MTENEGKQEKKKRSIDDDYWPSKEDSKIGDDWDGEKIVGYDLDESALVESDLLQMKAEGYDNIEEWCQAYSPEARRKIQEEVEAERKVEAKRLAQIEKTKQHCPRCRARLIRDPITAKKRGFPAKRLYCVQCERFYKLKDVKARKPEPPKEEPKPPEPEIHYAPHFDLA